MHESKPIRVIIADDQEIIRNGLSALLRGYGDFELIGEARDGEEAVQLCGLVQPNVVLMDLKMPRLDGFAATRLIRQRWPEVQVLVLTHYNEKEMMQSALEAGAMGFLSKDISAEELSSAIRRVHEGHPTIINQDGSWSGFSIKSTHMNQELLMAARIQSSILPARPPAIRGWDIAAKLEPASETSGDFYDFIPLANGKWGIVIADVADKGIGAALMMALSSSLIRTYATQYPTMPAFAMSTVNDRLLSDTGGIMFVTAFYGVLEPETGRLRYINAGHNPPYFISGQRGKPSDRLKRTGMALGVMDDATWQQKMLKFSGGDLLLLYTDGVTDAQNASGRFFGEQRMMEVVRAKKGCPAHEIRDTLLADVNKFTGGVIHEDDLTLIVLARKN